jgi:hypothetical protein
MLPAAHSHYCVEMFKFSLIGIHSQCSQMGGNKNFISIARDPNAVEDSGSVDSSPKYLKYIVSHKF